MPPPVGKLQPASSKGAPAQSVLQLPELAHSLPRENSPIINTQNWSQEEGVCKLLPCPSCKIDFSVNENTALLSLLCALAVLTVAIKFIQGKLAFILGSLTLGKTDKQMGVHQAMVNLVSSKQKKKKSHFVFLLG